MGALPHPVTGDLYVSPVPPGTGWPEDPAEGPVTGTSGRRIARRARSAAGVRRQAAGAGDVAALDARVSVCAACPRLVAWREEVAQAKRAAYAGEPYWGRAVPGVGPADAAVLVVGLAPAAHGANRTGRMFTGDRSGEWIYRALHRAGYASRAESLAAGDGLELLGARITAPVHCAPPDNRPTTEERHACRPWLERELSLMAPHLRSILALGGLGWDSVLTAARALGWEVPRPRTRFGHGATAALTVPGHGVDSARPVRLVGSYHVSQQNTFTGRLTEEMLDEVVARL